MAIVEQVSPAAPAVEAASGPADIDLTSGSSGSRGQQPTPRRRRTKRLPYISGLDGLRAIAVLAVMLYHADLPWMPGGFLGVDIFFVLSGFLITSLVLGELERTDRLDFKNFYIRRARRLLPALFLLLGAVAIVGAFLATDAAAGLRRDIPSSLLYVTNWVYVFTEQSYFETIGRPPLLEHLWSLAVEEQFYLIWPLVTVLAFRRGQRKPGSSGRRIIRRWAVIGALGSTALMIGLSLASGFPQPNDGSRAYFGTDTHAMGLLIGAALATIWLPQYIRKVAMPARMIINVIGVGALVLAIWVMTSTQANAEWLYRGGFLLFAIVIAFLIAAVTHPSSDLGKLLGQQPLRYIGERSYGLYLWHWPIFLILRPGLDVPVTGTWNVALRFAVTFAVAELSYRYVEMPIRRGALQEWWRWLRTQSTAIRTASIGKSMLAASVAVLVLGTAGVRVATMPEESVDYLGGVTEVSALDSELAALTRLAAKDVKPKDSDAVPAVEPSQSPEPSASTAPSSSPSPTASATPPTAKRPLSAIEPGVLAIGESVMLGARGGLDRKIKDVSIDAAVGRQATDVLTQVEEFADKGLLPGTVVIHTGTNGYIQKDELRRMLKALSGVQRVVLVNVSVPRIWQDPNNELIAEMADKRPNVVVADWRAVVAGEPGLTVKDGIHLNETGVKRYAATIKAAIQAARTDPTG